MNSTIYTRSHRGAPLTRALQLGGVLVTALLLSACSRRPIIVQAAPTPAPTATIIHTPAPVAAPQPVVGTSARDVIVLKEAPPPVREEAPPPPPSTSYTWVPGYWTARNGRQEWVAGRYEMPPHSGATWVAPRWERRADGYVFVDGYWR
jgi:hypothetical protein